MDAVIVYGEMLTADSDRFGAVTALGLDETRFAHEGQFRTQAGSTQIVDSPAVNSSIGREEAEIVGPDGPSQVAMLRVVGDLSRTAEDHVDNERSTARVLVREGPVLSIDHGVDNPVR